MIDQHGDGVTNLSQIVRWILVAIPTAMPDAPFNNSLGSFRRKTAVLQRAVEVVDEVDGFFFQIDEHSAEMRDKRASV